MAKWFLRCNGMSRYIWLFSVFRTIASSIPRKPFNTLFPKNIIYFTITFSKRRELPETEKRINFSIYGSYGFYFYKYLKNDDVQNIFLEYRKKFCPINIFSKLQVSFLTKIQRYYHCNKWFHLTHLKTFDTFLIESAVLKKRTNGKSSGKTPHLLNLGERKFGDCMRTWICFAVIFDTWLEIFG